MLIYGRLPAPRSPKADRHRKIEPTLRAFLPNPTLPTILNYASFEVQERLHGPKLSWPPPLPGRRRQAGRRTKNAETKLTIKHNY